ncbi:hypothetical protein GQ607_009449 [Colletotrichum asianum]|uniref:Methyltransferase domain-containing protein n=1 Tax=Colletotrichum asianum TaxID=702518 RepID=A0A8H3WCQ1_9PEZI|nr:hypothetical protein GQ607_009449 [Colletotrichum asianum]
MSSKAPTKSRWAGSSLLALIVPVALLYLFTPSLNVWWKTFISAQNDPHAGELARAAISEASWLRSVRQRHDWMEKNLDYDDTLFSPRDESLRFWYTLWDLFPATYSCPWDLQRVGKLGDGGKWICGMSKYAADRTSAQRPLRVYSFGVGSDSTFEEEFLNRSSRAEVWGFDDTVEMWGRGLDGHAYEHRAHLSKAAVAGYDFFDEKDKTQFWSISSIMKKFGHDYVDLVKMDIEGDEFPTLEAFLEEFKTEGKEVPFGQLVIEIHVPEKGPKISQFAEWWERLEALGLRPVMSEANLLAVTVGDGQPCCVEYTWINTRDSRGILWE